LNKTLALLALAALPTLANDEILRRMDLTAASFGHMTAKVEKIKYTAVLKDSEKESGDIRLARLKGGKLEMRIDFTQPNVRSLEYFDKKMQIFYPKIRTVQIFDVGKFDTMVRSMLAIGFGTSTAELKKSYEVKVAGEALIDGRKTIRVELLPTKEDARQHVKRIELWLLESDASPVRQKMTQPSGDYEMVTYRDMKIFAQPPAESFRLALPKDVKKEYPGR
jgi:outer membrane lipoprotein-sorting protein